MSFDPNAQDVSVQVIELGALLADVQSVEADIVQQLGAPASSSSAFFPAVIDTPALIVPIIEVLMRDAPIIEVSVSQGIPGPTGPAGAAGDGSDIPDLTTYFENGLI